ncbi:Mu transposase domain-containing protein [Tomitella gaofuii]|uniref:Mu transposase domain-containing protein n=1 Tax=Tomitella gaofuii TaxID=2760083 RepID=UPI0015FD5846|nr:DDE-type integrase/transposase/recombinase [Tomitella gaofuii]
MLTWEEDVNAHALRKRGWTISAIARHLDRDRKTIRRYLDGTATPGVRTPAPDLFAPFEDYVRARLAEDPHLWARTLCDELEALGYRQSYQTLTRRIRNRGLRPPCPACTSATGRANAIIAHPPGEETQWDWVDLPSPPAAWGWGTTAHLLVGSLAHSGKWRGILCEQMDQPHLIDGLDRICRRLGGLTGAWRFDRMATVCHPDTGRVTASFAGAAKYYGVTVAICPPRRGNRKGVVEKANHTAAQRWWRNIADEMTIEQAQHNLDEFCAVRMDARPRDGADGPSTVAAVAEAERLRPVPQAPYPATLTAARTASRQALVSFRGNRYSVPPELAGTVVEVSMRLDSGTIDIASAAGIVIARHRLAAAGTGAVVRDHGHVVALDAAAMAAANTARPHRRKERIPPGPEARAAAEKLRRGVDTGPDTATGSDKPISSSQSNSDTSDSTITNLAAYERAARGRNTLP